MNDKDEPKTVRIVAREADAGMRVDALVRRHLPGFSRSLLRQLFSDGRVWLGERITRKGQRVEVGDCISLLTPAADRAHPNAELELDVVYEDDQCVIVNKPHGLACAVLHGEDLNTLSNALVARYPGMANFGQAREAGLVHRLDNDTSGLVLAAKTPEAFAELRSALQDGRINKRYLAIVERMDHDRGQIASNMTPAPGRRGRVRPTELWHEHDDSAAAELPANPRATYYQVLDRSPNRVLLELGVSKAYRHQLRAHLAAVGAPIWGDKLYGSSRPHLRHALHASAISYGGGATVAAFEAKAALPRDLLALLDDLRT